MTRPSYRRISATVGTVNGGVGVNWNYLGLSPEGFKRFFNEFLQAMGFALPSTVHIERNSIEGRVDWNRMRISSEECELHRVHPEVAVRRARIWLSNYRQLNLRFELEPKESLPTR